MLDKDFRIKIIDFATAKIIGKYFDHSKMTFETEEISSSKEIHEREQEEIKRRTTFCGTAEYVSPEMLQGEYVDMAADYWALGCIIYHLLVGVSPFKDKSQYMVFQNIKNLKINYQDVPMEAMDLIDKLLVHKPEDRLGYLSMEDLLIHDFFKEDDGSSLLEFINSTPIPEKNSLLTKNIKKQMELQKTISKKPNNEEQGENNSSGIIILKHQIVEKKSPYFHYNTRKLVLDTTPKLEYIDPTTNVTKGVIYLSQQCKAEKLSSTKFSLTTPNRVFTFKVFENESDVWCTLINEQIGRCTK